MKEIKFLLALLLLLAMTVFSYALGRDDFFNEQIDPDPPATVTNQNDSPAGATAPTDGWNEDYWNQWNGNDNSSTPDTSLQQQQSGTGDTQDLREELTAEQQAAAVPEEVIPEQEKPAAEKEKSKETTKVKNENKAATAATGSDAADAATDSDAASATDTDATAFHWQYVIIGVFLLAAGAIAAYLVIHRKNAP